MQSNHRAFRRWLGAGLVLGLAWLPAACGNKDNGNQAVYVDNSDTGTGGVTGTTGVPAGTGGGSSGSSGSTGTTGQPSPSPDTSPGGTGTGTGTGGSTGTAVQPSPAVVTQTEMLSATDNNQRKPTTRMEPIQGQIAVAQGFSLGTSNGQILIVPPDANLGTPAPLILRAATGSPFTEALTNPWDLASDGTSNLIVTDGVGISGQPGRVLRVTNITINPSTPAGAIGNAQATFLNAAAGNSTAIFNPLYVEPVGGGIIFVSEYMPTPTGSIRRIDLNTGNSTTVVTGLNYPAGMAADLTGGFLYVCQNGAGNGGPNGSIIRVSLAAINNLVQNGGTPIGPNDAASVSVISTSSSQGPFNRPWECRLDSAGGLITAEGMALGGVVQGAPQPANQPAGAIRYVPRGSTAANTIVSGLSNCAGLSFQGTAGAEDLVFFTEAQSNPTGRVLSLRFNTQTMAIAPGGFLTYGAGFNSPIDTLPSSNANGLPLKAAINFAGGAGNQGRVLDFR